MTRKNGQRLIVPPCAPLAPPDFEVQCDVKPECAGCPYPAHGFICWFADGACLKNSKTTFQGGKEHDKHFAHSQ